MGVLGVATLPVSILLGLWALLKFIVALMLSVGTGKKRNQKSATNSNQKKKKSVAVIGGGIAGTSAAWALAESGQCDVTLFEARPVLGGNAKTMQWDECGKDLNSGEALRTGLSVLAWPDNYFRHYTELLKRLKIPTQDVKPKFYVDADEDCFDTKWGPYCPQYPGVRRGGPFLPVFAHGEPNYHWRKDMDRWDRMIQVVRSCNYASAKLGNRLSAFFNKLLGRKSSCAKGKSNNNNNKRNVLDDKPSFYTVSLINPMNIIPLRFLSRWVFGVSDAFWEMVVIPVYSSSFLTCCLDGIPAVIAPALDDIISVGRKEELKTLKTWVGSSKDVFDAMATRIGKENIVLNADIQYVSTDDGTSGGTVAYAGGSKSAQFDYIVFACPANAVDKLTKSDDKKKNSLRSMLFNQILPEFKYENQRDDSFTTGQIHSKKEYVMAENVMPDYFESRFSNYLKLRRNRITSGAGSDLQLQVENTFTLGTWVPAALRTFSQQRGEERQKNGESFDCFVTYNPKSPIPQEHERGVVDNSWAHPQLSFKMMALARAVSFLQGKENVFYCGSYTTPGNGHDLSLLSGLVVADALLGGGGKHYAFKDCNNPALEEDFKHLQSLMGF